VNYVGSDLVAMHVMQQQLPEINECLFEDLAVMVMQSQHQRSMVLRGMEPLPEVGKLLHNEEGGCVEAYVLPYVPATTH
jgi:hypothetical protein